MTKYKICSSCKENKLLLEFPKDLHTKDKLSWFCKPCKIECSERSRIKVGREKNIKMYMPVSGILSKHSKEEDLIKLECEVCKNIFYPTSKYNIYCATCSNIVAKKVRPALEIRGKISLELKTKIAIKYINTNQCIYCKRDFSENNPKNIIING
jgi:ribosomal protein S27E